MMPCLRRIDYKDRLKELNMFSLGRRYVRGDLIEVYKIINGMENVCITDVFEMFETTTTRGHGFKFKMKYCRLDIRKYSFAIRVVERWNSLSDETVKSSSLDMFFKRLDLEMNN